MSPRRPPRLVDAAPALVFFAAGLLAAELAFGAKALRDPLLLAAKHLLWYAVPLALYPAVARLSYRKTYPLGAPRPVALALSVVASASLTALLVAAMVGWMAWLEAVGYRRLPQDVERVRGLVMTLLGARPWLGAAVLCLVPGVLEELLFRGIFLSSLRSALRPEAAVVLCAWFFGLVHLGGGGPLQAALVLYIGVHLGLLVWWTGSLWCAMAGHAVNNLLVVGMTVAAGEGVVSAPIWVVACLPAAAVAYGLSMTWLWLHRARGVSPPPGAG